MNRSSLYFAALALVLLGVGPATASTLTESFSGTFIENSNSFAFSGNITLDVSGGQAIDGTGTISIFGLSNVAMVLITPSTPGNETNPGPVGYRANDGTDFGGLNTIIPIDLIGLLFDVDTTTAAFGQFPLLNLASGPNNSTFTGVVNGVEYYDVSGTADLTITPLPAALPMFAAGFGVLGLLGWRRKRRAAVAV